MNTITIAAFAGMVVVLGLYLMRRRARLNRED